jgi:aerobic-type carbon monoxide dehydrogenase small subunit (CoxS/CutS family)
LLDGQPVRSCITQVARAAGKQIMTIEGLEHDGNLHPLQDAFIKADAMQCAYCTSGMIMAAAGLLKKNAKPSRSEIIEGMNGNICRCGTYQRIIEAIQIASGQATAREVA